ncbi:MAG TPA: DUF433 domain-containing protein [archaeon]|nr:DUF433 domain-containing protein [archaeon]
MKEVNPEVIAGKPVIRGTRISVDIIVKLLSKGITTEEILENYPNLKKEDIKAALEYAVGVIEGEDVFPKVKTNG